MAQMCLMTPLSVHAGNTTEFGTSFGGLGDEPSGNLIDMAMADDVTRGFDWYRPAAAMRDVTRGVPSLADLATADEARLTL